MKGSYRMILGALAFLLLGACAPSSESGSKPRFLWIEAAASFPYYGNSEDAIVADCARIAQMGFTDIVVDVRPTSGDVLFRSKVAAPLRKIALWREGTLEWVEREADFDYLAAFIRAGHAAGLRVHAGVNVMVGGFRCDAGNVGLVYEHPELQSWCSVDYTPAGLVNQADDTASLGGRFLDPAHPGVQAYLLDMLTELAAYEGLDGMVLDRCRYDDYALDAGYTEAARERFTAYLGHEPSHWPVFTEPGKVFLEDVPSEEQRAWLTFRCQVIHDFVAQVAERVHATAPSLRLGIYVGAWFSEYYRSGVNWTSPRYPLADEEESYAWATDEYQATGLADLVDYVLLGAYTAADAIHGEGEWTMEGFAQLARKRLAGDVPFYCGPDIGNGAGFEAGGRGELMPEITETMLQAADGLFVFDLCHIRRFDYWNAFRP